MKVIISLAFFIRLVLTESLKGSFDKLIVFSCQSALSQYKFGCDESSWSSTCSYPPMIGSMSQCVDVYSPEASKESSLRSLRDSCEKFGNVTITKAELENIMKNATELLTTPDNPGFDKSEVKYIPVLPYENDVVRKLKDYRAFLGNFDVSQYYGVLINVYWIGVMVWFAVWNRLKEKSIIHRLIGENVNFIRSNLTLSLLFGHHYQPFQLGWGLSSLLPSGSESCVLFGYFFLNTIFLFIGYDIFKENSIFGSNTVRQFIRYISDRSGVLSFAHFPLLIIFAGRNNIFISLTKLPYSSFMIFHKWTARVMFINAMIHTVGYFQIILSRESLWESLHHAYILWGSVAILVGSGIILQAIHNFRIRNYEVFLVLHIVLALGFMATCWKHCKTFGWLEWIYGSMLIWASDRVLRSYKLWKFGCPRADLKFISDETFKVSVHRPANWEPFPGCFVYIHFLHWSTFWQSHPFTIVDSILENDMVTIYIKAKSGVTKRILGLILSRGGKTSMRVSVEGPYGNQSPLKSYKTALLFAGGNGIPGPFYHAIHLATHTLLSSHRIKLIWVIRQIDSICWFEKELIKLHKLNSIECDIYITRNFQPEMIPYVPVLNQFANSNIKFYSGRANNGKILLDEFINAQGSIGIVTCGPPIMCDDIRRFTSQNLDTCPYRVDLFEELQVW